MILYRTQFSKIMVIMLLSLLLSACFGPRLNRKNLNNETDPQFIVAQSSNQHIKVTVNALLFRNHPSSWAKDAKWDEYIFTVDNLSDLPITIDNVYIFGALDERHSPQTNRIQLLGATRATKKRYKNAGNKIKLGAGSTKALMGSITGTALGVGLGAGIAGSTAVSTSAGTLTAAGGAVVVAVPLIAIGGITKLVINKKVSNQIKNRQTTMPITVDMQQNQLIDLFYSAVPGPQRIEIKYQLGNNAHQLNIDLSEQLSQLHFKNQKE